METKNSSSQTQLSKAEFDKAVKAEVERIAGFNKYHELHGEMPDEKLTAEELTEMNNKKLAEIREQEEKDAKAAAAAKKPLKIKHKDEDYEFPASEKGNFIVRHSKMFQSPTGQSMEDPGSVRTQIYRPEVYADLINENEKTGEQNAFVQSGEKTIVLHDPTK